MRLDFDIPEEEKNFLVKRRNVVSQALQKALNLSSAPEPSKVQQMQAQKTQQRTEEIVMFYYNAHKNRNLILMFV